MTIKEGVGRPDDRDILGHYIHPTTGESIPLTKDKIQKTPEGIFTQPKVAGFGSASEADQNS